MTYAAIRLARKNTELFSMNSSIRLQEAAFKSVIENMADYTLEEATRLGNHIHTSRIVSEQTKCDYFKAYE